MFGHYQKAQDQMKQKISDKNKKNEAELAAERAQREKNQKEADEAELKQKRETSAKEREESYAKGRQRVKDLYADESIIGLDPVKRQAMQYEANKGIQRSVQSANRKLLGEQSQHGITGRGGVGYAQQRDLQRMGTEAQGAVHRDLDKMNADLRLKNIAATFAGEQGEAAQDQLDRQLALDEINLRNERKRQQEMEDQIYRQFSRV